MAGPIVGVALRHLDSIFALPKPFRHHNLLHIYFRTFGKRWPGRGPEAQGFVDEDGIFLDRVSALARAQEHNQLLPNEPIHAKMLFSENLW